MNQDVSIGPSIHEVDELNSQAWDKRITDSILAQQLSHKALQLAIKLDYVKGKAEGMRTGGFCLIRLSKYGEAYDCLNEALSLFESINDLRGQSTVYQYFGIIQRTWGNLGASLEFIYRALALSEETSFTEHETTNYYQLGVTYKHLGNYEKALDCLYKSLSLSRATKFMLMEAYSINVIGSIYFENEDYTQALVYFQQGLINRQQSGDKWGEAGSLDNIGSTHLKMGAWQQAIYFCEQSLVISRATGDKKGQSNALLHLAEINKQTNNVQRALEFCNESLIIRQEVGDKKGEAEILLFVAELQRVDIKETSKGDLLDGIFKALSIAQEIKAGDLIGKTHWSLYESYKVLGHYKEALAHLELNMNIEKELHKDAINQKFKNLEISHKAEESKKETEIFRLRNVELAGLYEEGKKQKEEIELRKRFVEDALRELKIAQAQLIQSEKMASLGELTAGIAHEIQNPLNFINNFSEVNKELLIEMNEEIDKEHYTEVISIANEVTGNEEKINHHGKRADAIVKGMLQHSHSSSANKEPTDINKLADEFLRLSYHGLRAKDKTFNANLKNYFDDAVGKIDVIPQDIGRVLFNLFNNAFYSVAEKRKQGLDGYEPTIEITTQRMAKGILIRVRDNGMGIPQAVLDKIYQPFFTTKPTGEGTGLGLSMAYDIITKGHGGTVEAKTEEGTYAEFNILLPALKEA